MKSAFRLLAVALTVLVLPPAHAEPPWKKWPTGAGDVDASAMIPPGFTVVKPSVPDVDRTILNGRFRSPDGKAEFAVTVVYTRQMKRSVAARTIKLPLLPAESVRERTPSTRHVKSEDGDYDIFDEDITVAGPGRAYTRYFHLEISTSSLPGECSVLWEFKSADDQARKAYQAAYRRFKELVSFGED